MTTMNKFRILAATLIAMLAATAWCQDDYVNDETVPDNDETLAEVIDSKQHNKWTGRVVQNDRDAEILLHGYSMGAVTVMLATGEKLPPQVKAAVCDCGFTSCWEQYANVIKLYANLPAFPLLYAVNATSILRGNFDIRKNKPIDAVRRSVTPTVFLHGTADNFVPFAMMDRLYDACAAPKAKQAIADADHAQSVYVDPKLYWETIDSFLKDRIT